MMRSNAPRSTIRSLITGNALRAPRLQVQLVAVLEIAQRELAHRGARHRPVRHAVDHEAARSADAFAAIVLERHRIFALLRSALRSARPAFPAWTCPDSGRPDRSAPCGPRPSGSSAARCEESSFICSSVCDGMHVLECQRLLVQHRRRASAPDTPRPPHTSNRSSSRCASPSGV